VVDGEIVRGANNSAGEVGHMTIKAGGPRCACGARGHLEPLASRSAVVDYIAKRAKKGDATDLSRIVDGNLQDATSGDLARAYRHGDKLVTEAIHRSAKYLSIGIASVANLLNPELVILGGGLVDALGEPYLQSTRKELEGRPMLAATKPLKIEAAALGDDAGIVGAGLVARNLARRRAEGEAGAPAEGREAAGVP
jgi:glucokinase